MDLNNTINSLGERLNRRGETARERAARLRRGRLRDAARIRYQEEFDFRQVGGVDGDDVPRPPSAKDRRPPVTTYKKPEKTGPIFSDAAEKPRVIKNGRVVEAVPEPPPKAKVKAVASAEPPPKAGVKAVASGANPPKNPKGLMENARVTGQKVMNSTRGLRDKRLGAPTSAGRRAKGVRTGLIVGAGMTVAAGIRNTGSATSSGSQSLYRH